MPQTTYSQDPPQALPGMIVEREQVVGMYQSSEVIPPGCFVELSAGKLRRVQATTFNTPALPIVGVAAYRSASDPGNVAGGYAVGEYIPVLRKGKIWASVMGTVISNFLAKPNVAHSSTTATTRGYVTASATSAVAGSEIDNAPPGVTAVKMSSDATMALLELNIPSL